jgi:polyhydroxyalkanoate synthesis regulator phasin
MKIGHTIRSTEARLQEILAPMIKSGKITETEAKQFGIRPLERVDGRSELGKLIESREIRDRVFADPKALPWNKERVTTLIRQGKR